MKARRMGRGKRLKKEEGRQVQGGKRGRGCKKWRRTGGRGEGGEGVIRGGVSE